jgi:hypothetical protein
MAAKRPDPLHWLWYAFGGRLPDRYRDWVLHDVSDASWRLRYAIQILARTLPFLLAGFLVLLLLPGIPAGLALAGMVVALLFTLYFTLTSAGEFREVRLVQHGFKPGTRGYSQSRARKNG